MVAIAIFSVDPVLRGNLEQLPREDPAITVVGIVDSPSALLELAETHHVDVVLAETLPNELLTDRQVRHQQTFSTALTRRLALTHSVPGHRPFCPELLTEGK